jgi:hypothetical protein
LIKKGHFAHVVCRAKDGVLFFVFRVFGSVFQNIEMIQEREYLTRQWREIVTGAMSLNRWEGIGVLCTHW